MDKQQQIQYSNNIFKLFILDLTTTKQITIYKITKECNLTKNFLYNKMEGYTIQYVSLPTIILICKTFSFPFDILKYISQLEYNK